MKPKRKSKLHSRHSPEAKAAIMEVLDNQLRENNPPETRATYERLKQAGINEEETRRLLACAIAAEIFDILTNKEAFDLARFTKKLSTLPEMPWMDEE
jgi:hypothetical protein